MTDVLEKTALHKDDVLNYIKDNPDVLHELLPERPRPRKGQPADFQSYMIERLRADKEEVINSTREIVENARSNMNNQQRIHAAVLRLLEAQSFDEFIQCITTDLANQLDVDISVLVVESEEQNIPDVRQNGIRILPPGTVDSWMGDKSVLLQDNISGIEAIYGGGAALVASQILLRVDISEGTPPAILAFGSRDANMFSDGQATDQILFLARVIERVVRSWLSQ